MIIHDIDQRQKRKTDGCDEPNANEEEKEVVFREGIPANSQAARLKCFPRRRLR